MDMAKTPISVSELLGDSVKSRHRYIKAATYTEPVYSEE